MAFMLRFGFEFLGVLTLLVCDIWWFDVLVWFCWFGLLTCGLVVYCCVNCFEGVLSDFEFWLIAMLVICGFFGFSCFCLLFRLFGCIATC